MSNSTQPRPDAREDAAADAGTGASPRRRWILALALLGAVAAFSYLAFGDIGENLIYYWSPTELREAADRAAGANVRLGGLVEAGSVVYHADGLTIDFQVTDGKSTVPVRTTAVPPAMFREGIGVVLEGSLSPTGVFETERLMVKHDNEYKAPDEVDDRTIEDLVKTMQFERTDT
ncbi:MAG: cytochrome c maturation protein CcmE [Acidobacteria bacterium]|nr:MAG: cytochrome c maturation protein CcmE [Acidobacteriota bacterium]REK12133.1 MAG: cytochrome c maturation protein CcmE [Acidobacteriota bacterium]